MLPLPLSEESTLRTIEHTAVSGPLLMNGFLFNFRYIQDVYLLCFTSVWIRLAMLGAVLPSLTFLLESLFKYHGVNCEKNMSNLCQLIVWKSFWKYWQNSLNSMDTAQLAILKKSPLNVMHDWEPTERGLPNCFHLA